MTSLFSSPRDIERKAIAMAVDERGHRINTGEVPHHFVVYSLDSAVVPATAETLRIALRAVGVQNTNIEEDIAAWMRQWAESSRG